LPELVRDLGFASLETPRADPKLPSEPARTAVQSQSRSTAASSASWDQVKRSPFDKIPSHSRPASPSGSPRRRAVSKAKRVCAAAIALTFLSAIAAKGRYLFSANYSNFLGSAQVVRSGLRDGISLRASTRLRYRWMTSRWVLVPLGPILYALKTKREPSGSVHPYVKGLA
jgi:ferric-dicitrate binding protein FerR (iron transport regulator)